MRFDDILVIDWSAASKPVTGKDSIWIGHAGAGAQPPVNPSTRQAAMAVLMERITLARAAGRRVLVAADFPFGYPAGFASALTGQPMALGLWQWLREQITDSETNQNNRFELADRINATLPGIGPFWGRPENLALTHLPTKGLQRQQMPFPERRAVEALEPKAHPVWKLYTNGSVGGQALLGIARFQALRAALGADCAVWPFERCDRAGVVLAEVWPSMLAPEVASLAGAYPCKDAAQVDLLAKALAGLTDQEMDRLMAPEMPSRSRQEEGWILAAGEGETLRKTLTKMLPELTPPRLRNDCFAMPQGVSWIPVDEALLRLRNALTPLTTQEALPVARAGGRVLAEDVTALRSNPPRPNSAVDGYGFAAQALSGDGPYTLPLVNGRAAAGQPFAGSVPAGSAVRILTGAILPEGVDTVVLEEDCATDTGRVAFDGPIKPRSNTRKAGEDVSEGAVALTAGRKLTPADLALLPALGVASVSVFRRLRVGVLSTGDEIIARPDLPAEPHQIYDANRPMLLELARRWDFEAVDLGHVRDNARQIAGRLDRAAQKVDVILTSGGASAGDEDHVSRLLRSRGQLSSWRIAMKPGRPLALALWQGVPVLGLPGNPVAAFVCALIFGRPALSMMAGAEWLPPVGYDLSAAFEKRKKAGRREYLRARLNEQGQVEVFRSEGSGRISGLSWAEGLVELPDGAVDIGPGSKVRFLPFGSFGL